MSLKFVILGSGSSMGVPRADGYVGNCDLKNKKNFFTLSKNSSLDEAASKLYKTFRLIKKKGYKKIQIAKIPMKGSGIAINDRIKRAASKK